MPLLSGVALVIGAGSSESTLPSRLFVRSEALQRPKKAYLSRLRQSSCSFASRKWVFKIDPW